MAGERSTERRAIAAPDENAGRAVANQLGHGIDRGPYRGEACRGSLLKDDAKRLVSSG